MRAEDLRRLTVRREQRVYERRRARHMTSLRERGELPEDEDAAADEAKTDALSEWHPSVRKLVRTHTFFRVDVHLCFCSLSCPSLAMVVLVSICLPFLGVTLSLSLSLSLVRWF